MPDTKRNERKTLNAEIKNGKGIRPPFRVQIRRTGSSMVRSRGASVFLEKVFPRKKENAAHPTITSADGIGRFQGIRTELPRPN